MKERALPTTIEVVHPEEDGARARPPPSGFARWAQLAARDVEGLGSDAKILYFAARQDAQRAAETIRRSPRFARIVGEAVATIHDYRLVRDRPEIDMERFHRRCAVRIHDLCVELRGGVLKVGQFVSSRVDLLPEPYLEVLGKLQDRVPPVPTRAIERRIEAELGCPTSNLFGKLDPVPIAAASLAQVHGAELPDGTRVAVKVQLPGIGEVLKIDLSGLRTAARILHSSFPQIHMVTVARELSRSVEEELDFRMEANNVRAFRKRFAEDGEIVVPHVYDELSSLRVLTLERIDGERFVDYLEGCKSRGEEGEKDRDTILRIMVRAFCEQIVEHGVFHADPHPGNFLVMPGPKLAILDLGSVATLTPAQRRLYARLAMTVMARDPEGMTQCLNALGFRAGPASEGRLRRYVDAFFSAFDPSALVSMESETDVLAELRRALRFARKHPLTRVPREVVQLARVFGTLGGLFAHYRPRFDLMQEVGPYISKAASAE